MASSGSRLIQYAFELVAVVGVIVPTALGWATGRVVLPDHHWPVHMFIGATLCATSVGITARLRIIDTSQPSPDDFLEGEGHVLQTPFYDVGPRSVVVLQRE